jgi:hypothetical protein
MEPEFGGPMGPYARLGGNPSDDNATDDEDDYDEFYSEDDEDDDDNAEDEDGDGGNARGRKREDALKAFLYDAIYGTMVGVLWAYLVVLQVRAR